MAKRGRKKKKKFTLNTDLTGIILGLISIIGLFQFGAVGKYIKIGAMYVGGNWWFLVLILLLILGAYMLINRGAPNVLSGKFIGILLFFCILLAFSHLNFIKNETEFNVVYNNTLEMLKQRSVSLADKPSSIFDLGDATKFIGGGMLGCLVAGGLNNLFAYTGTIVVLCFLILLAIVLTFNVTFRDIFAKIIRLFNKEVDPDEDEDEEPKKNKKHKDIEVEGDELISVNGKEVVAEEKEEVEDKRIVISSIDELKNRKLDVEKEEVPVSENNNGKPSVESFDQGKPEDLDEARYRLPKFELLTPLPKNNKNSEEEYIKQNIKALEQVLLDFEIKGRVIDKHIGPAVTEYEVTVPNGTKVNKITNINKEIALAMAAKDVRIQAPIPGKSTIGIEIPNREIAAVGIREVLEETAGQKSENKILVALGKDIMGNSILCDLAKMPHLLVAGSTGSGKSVCINGIIASILMRYKPNEVKLVLVDPKKVELSNYNGTPHLLCPVVTDPRKASATLQKLVTEMDNRYQEFADKSVKNIAGYNDMIDKENKKHPETHLNRMPYIVIIIDELADLMLVASKEVEASIMRITQLARAAGIHLIVATQRPSTDIITGVIKTNIPSRISFAVASQIDSRTILDQAGAEKLLGKGDMLYLPMGENVPVRIQGCFINDNDIQKLIDYCQTQATAKYEEVFTAEDLHTSASGSSNSDGGDDEPMYDEIVQFAVETGKISASLIQRRFRFGYNRAARMIDLLEARGVVGPQNGSKPREVLIKLEGQESKVENEE